MCCTSATVVLLGFENPSVVQYKEGDRVIKVRLSGVPCDSLHDSELTRQLNIKYSNTQAKFKNNKLVVKTSDGWASVDGVVQDAIEHDLIVYTLEVKQGSRSFRIYMH